MLVDKKERKKRKNGSLHISISGQGRRLTSVRFHSEKTSLAILWKHCEATFQESTNFRIESFKSLIIESFKTSRSATILDWRSDCKDSFFSLRVLDRVQLRDLRCTCRCIYITSWERFRRWNQCNASKRKERNEFKNRFRWFFIRSYPWLFGEEGGNVSSVQSRSRFDVVIIPEIKQQQH